MYYLGIELGSTRIKASLIDDTFAPVASGGFDWENSFENGYWTYALKEVHEGLKACFRELKKDVKEKLGFTLKKVDAIGVSAMMHGYLPFDKDGNQLAGFRTWRNTTTEEASEKLSGLFDFHIPQRWSIAHLYQAILNNEPHVRDIAHIMTLAEYVHYLLTGKMELGVGDASGMFPISGNDFDEDMLEKFRQLIKEKGFSWDIRDILPNVKKAGESSGILTEEGAKLLDPDGDLEAGILCCPPEGDAGTGMVATNAVLPKTGNVSAGTSIFSMLVLEKPLLSMYSEVDIVTTPDGLPVAMVHCNNCCGELDKWVNMFGEFAALIGKPLDKSNLYNTLYQNALNGETDGITAFNYISGEHVTGIEKGRPMIFHTPESNFNLAGLIKAQLYASMATLKIGMDIFMQKENVVSEKFMAHGGLFKVKGVAQQMLSDALSTSVSVMETAGEGGAWGMALLAAYMKNKNGKTLGEWMEKDVFGATEVTTLHPEEKGVLEFKKFISDYKKGIAAERKAGEVC